MTSCGPGAKVQMCGINPAQMGLIVGAQAEGAADRTRTDTGGGCAAHIRRLL